ncbi:MAG TPA: DUF2225 domain-containing protein [Drouetiella sp.]
MNSPKLTILSVVAFGAVILCSCTPKESADNLTLDPTQIAAEHASTWKEKNESGLAALQSSDLAKAETELLAALKEAEACGKEDPRVAVTLMNIASLYEKQNYYPKAISHLQSARKIFRKAYGDNSEVVGVSEYHEAQVLTKEKKWSESIPLFEESLKVLKSHNADSYSDAQKDYEEARKHVVPVKSGAK